MVFHTRRVDSDAKACIERHAEKGVSELALSIHVTTNRFRS